MQLLSWHVMITGKANKQDRFFESEVVRFGQYLKKQFTIPKGFQRHYRKGPGAITRYVNLAGYTQANTLTIFVDATF